MFPILCLMDICNLQSYFLENWLWQCFPFLIKYSKTFCGKETHLHLWITELPKFMRTQNHPSPSTFPFPPKPVACEWNAVWKTLYHSRVLSWGTLDTWPRWLLVGGSGCPMCHRMFSSMLGLYPLDASSPLPVAWSKSVCRSCQCSLGGKIAPWLRIAVLLGHYVLCKYSGV